MTVDLHGIKHQDVCRKLDEIVWECMQRNKTQITIITGKSDRMKEIVKECLKDYRLMCFELFDGGSLVVNLF